MRAASGLLLAFLPCCPIAGSAGAQDNPCANYARALAYSRTADPTPVTLIMTEPTTGAEVEFKIARHLTALNGNLSDGPQCRIGFELMWPQMTAGGLIADHDKRIRDRMIGDMPTWRLLTIDVQVERAAWTPWMVANGYCRTGRRHPELAEQPFGLRAFDDGRRWPRHRQADGSYRDMRALTAYPLNLANQFYAIDETDPQQAIRISCSKGAPRCRLHGHFQGFAATTFFNADDLVHWRDYRDAVDRFLSAHLVRSVPAKIAPDPGLHFNPESGFVACMRGMVGKGLIDAATLDRMGLNR